MTAVPDLIKLWAVTSILRGHVLEADYGPIVGQVLFILLAARASDSGKFPAAHPLAEVPESWHRGAILSPDQPPQAALEHALADLQAWYRHHGKAESSLPHAVDGLAWLDDSAARSLLQRMYEYADAVHAPPGTALRHVYEFFSARGGHAGPASTLPHGLGQAVVTLLQLEDGVAVADIACGNGVLLSETWEAAHGANLEVSLQGFDMNARSTTLANLLHIADGGCSPIAETRDVLYDPPTDDVGRRARLRRYDRILCATPFGRKLHSLERLQLDPFGRFTGDGLRTTAGDVAYLEHAWASLNDRGRAVQIVPAGLLFRSGRESVTRERLLQQDGIEAVISLPGGIWANTAIETALIVLNRAKASDRAGEVMFGIVGREETRSGNVIESKDLAEVLACWREWREDEDGRLVSIQSVAEVLAGDDVLAPDRFIDTFIPPVEEPLADLLEALKMANSDRNMAEQALERALAFLPECRPVHLRQLDQDEEGGA